MDFSEDMRIVDLELFDAAFPVAPGDEDDVKRRFMTLFAHTSATRRGGSSEVVKAENALGETFALKRLRLRGAGDAGAPEGKGPETPSQAQSNAAATSRRKEIRQSLGRSGSSGSQTPDYVTQGHVAAFYEEYRMHASVANLRGFPRLYGMGTSDGNPVIIMGWVEGVTLHDALRKAPSAELALETLAALGAAVSDVLVRAEDLNANFVHRDLSPRNIMLRTDAVSADAQFESRNFDVCLLDFGSSTLGDAWGTDGRDDSFTARANVWRMGTPAYAPPEMLTSDVSLPPSYRTSPTIDVYALCSILYELYAGRKPFDPSGSDGETPYRVKTGQSPEPLTPRAPDGGALAAIIMAGLALPQTDRPTPAQLKAALENWQRLPSQRPSRALRKPKQGDRSIWQPGFAQKILTRRAFVAVGIVAAAAVASTAIVGNARRAGTAAPDPSRYPTTSELYRGEPLFKVLDGAHPGWAFATASGDIACKPDSSRECGPLREGQAALFDDASRLYGFIVPDGNGSYAWHIPPSFAQVKDFSEGLAAAQDAQTRLWGYIAEDGTWAIAPQFSAAEPFSDGAASVRPAQEGGQWGAVDIAGAWLLEPRFSALGARSDEGFAVAEDEPGSWSIVDADGSWTGAQRFVQLRRFSHGIAPAQERESGLWGFVDAMGKWTLEPTFMDARPFSEGQAAVQDVASQLWYFIDATGRPAYDSKPRFWKLGDLHDGLAPAQASAQDATVVFDETDPDARVDYAGKRYGYVDAQGNWQMKRLTTLVDTAIGRAGI